MSKKLVFAAGILLSLAMLAGCRNEDPGVLTGIIFDRGHGSAWGNQFRVELVADEITLLQYIPEGSGDMETKEHLPLEDSQWEEISQAVQALDLQEDRPNLVQKLLKRTMLDGGEYRKLTLQWQQGDKVKKVQYLWPEGAEAERLEKLLVALIPVEKEPVTPPVIPEAVPEETPLGEQDSYWVATAEIAWGTEYPMGSGDWTVDLLIRADGTGRLRDVRNGLYLIDENDLQLRWEKAEDGALLFYNNTLPDPVIQAVWEDGILTANYIGTTLKMVEAPLPDTLCSPAELVGTWLLASTEVEGYESDAAPWQMEGIVFKQVCPEDTLTLQADLIRSVPFEETELLQDQELELLNGLPFTTGINDTWSVRIGHAAELEDNGAPKQVEYYATLTDRDTLVLQHYYNLDGYPAVSYQTYRRILPKVSQWEVTAQMLEDSSWVCAGYTAKDGTVAPAPSGYYDVSLYLHKDGRSTLTLEGDETTQIDTWWVLYGGGLLQLRGDSLDSLEQWYAGAVRGDYLPSQEEYIPQQHELYLVYDGGILRLLMDGRG